MESSVKTVAKPILDRLEPNFDKLDKFACTQLDRVIFFLVFFESISLALT